MDIIASIGPTLETVDDIVSAVKMGATIFRMPLGYRSRDYLSYSKNIRKAENIVNQKLFIFLDLPSSRPRIAEIEDISIKENDICYLVPANQNINYSQRVEIPLDNFNYILDNTNKGDNVSFLDGKVKFIVENVEEKSLQLKCISGQQILKTGNSVTLTSITNNYELVRDSDISLIKQLYSNNIEIDWVAFSFCENSNQIMLSKNIIIEHLCNKTPIFFAKIETESAFYNLHDIISSVDGVVVAKGDLLVNVSRSELVAEAQEQIIKTCNEKKLYSIISTELLENYSETKSVSRPEIDGLSLAISQQPSALQLAKETVFSSYPLETIKFLKGFIDYELFRTNLKNITLPKIQSRKHTKNKPFIVAIEGFNGVGKSTLCLSLCKYFNIEYRFGIPNFLIEKKLKQYMIADAHWYSSSLFFISGAIEQIKNCTQTQETILILDRSIWSTFAVQASNKPERLQKLIDVAYSLPELDIEPDLTIILRAGFETCQKRIKSKIDEDEKKLDELVNFKEFYQKEGQFYNWLSSQRTNILNIDANNLTKCNLSSCVIEVIKKKMRESN